MLARDLPERRTQAAIRHHAVEADDETAKDVLVLAGLDHNLLRQHALQRGLELGPCRIRKLHGGQHPRAHDARVFIVEAPERPEHGDQEPEPLPAEEDEQEVHQQVGELAPEDALDDPLLLRLADPRGFEEGAVGTPSLEEHALEDNDFLVHTVEFSLLDRRLDERAGVDERDGFLLHALACGALRPRTRSRMRSWCSCCLTSLRMRSPAIPNARSTARFWRSSSA